MLTLLYMYPIRRIRMLSAIGPPRARWAGGLVVGSPKANQNLSSFSAPSSLSFDVIFVVLCHTGNLELEFWLK